MKRVVIESPLSPSNGRTFAENIEYARRCCLDSLSRGEACYASHIFFTQFQDDTIPDQRRAGMEAGFVWGEAAEMVAVYVDFGVSKGMAEGIEKAEARGIPVEHRSIGGGVSSLPKTEGM